MRGQFDHVPVMGREVVELFLPVSTGLIVDATVGGGGHAALLLEARSDLRLLGIDRDADAVTAARDRLSVFGDRAQVVQGRFGELREILSEHGEGNVIGVLFDLGVSSAQLDRPERGFSYRFDAPLDMRMDTSGGITAADWLARATQSEIREVIRTYGEERFAKQIAAAIVAARARGPLRTTRQLAALVAAAVPAREPHQDPATRTFQALRIHVNQELEELSLALPQCVELLRPAGRLVVISFHSLEDRIVKRFLRDAARPDRLPVRLPVRARDLAAPRLRLVGRAVKPDTAEIAANSRARSAVMRIAEKEAT